MALTYLNGGRIQGSSTFSSPLNTGLKEIGRYKVCLLYTSPSPRDRG